ncbi:MAG: ATP-binding protein [Labilithrix sp.]
MPFVDQTLSRHLDWNQRRSIDRHLDEQLHSSLDFVQRSENLLLRGQAGVGKTTLAPNLGMRALEQGHTIRFCTLPAALADLSSKSPFLRPSVISRDIDAESWRIKEASLG